MAGDRGARPPHGRARARAPRAARRSTRSSRSDPIRSSRARCAPRSPPSWARTAWPRRRSRRADPVAGPRGRLETPVDRADVREGRWRGPRADAEVVYGETDVPERTRAWQAERGPAAPARRRDPLGARQGGGEQSADRRGGPRVVPGGRGRPRGTVCGGRRPAARRAWATTLTHVVNRNINFTNVCYVGCRFCRVRTTRSTRESYTLTLAEVADRAARLPLGVHRGVHAGWDPPRSSGSFYFDLLDAVKAAAGYPHPRVQPDGGAERLHEARDLVPRVPAGAPSPRPGYDPRDRGRDLGRRRSLGADQGQLPADAWEEIVRTAHDLGIRSSSTIMFGHVDAPPHWVFHIRRLARIQRDTAGSPSSSRSRSCTRTRRYLPRRQGAHPARRSTTTGGCTPSRGSCWTELSTTSRSRG